MSTDMIFDWRGNYAHNYGYIGNDPVNGTDLSGLFEVIEISTSNMIAHTIASIAAGVTSGIITFLKARASGLSLASSLYYAFLQGMTTFSMFFFIGILFLGIPFLAASAIWILVAGLAISAIFHFWKHGLSSETALSWFIEVVIPLVVYFIVFKGVMFFLGIFYQELFHHVLRFQFMRVEFLHVMELSI